MQDELNCLARKVVKGSMPRITDLRTKLNEALQKVNTAKTTINQKDMDQTADIKKRIQEMIAILQALLTKADKNGILGELAHSHQTYSDSFKKQIETITANLAQADAIIAKHTGLSDRLTK